MGEPIDAVAHHEAHGTGVVIGPDRFGAELALGLVEPVADFVQRLVPRHSREPAGAFRPGAAQRMRQPFRVVDALGVARHLGADDTRGIGLQFGAAHPPDALAANHFDIKRAGRGTIMRTGGVANIDLGIDLGVLVHGRNW